MYMVQRVLPIRVITVGKNRSVGVQLIVDEYIDKLNKYCKFEDVQIRSNPKNARYVFYFTLQSFILYTNDVFSVLYKHYCLATLSCMS